ncbi:type II toxin-antitoxin system Phd/YefM family antitoxin [Micromonospora sp. NBRC 101691]|uniref:type II toxin-antitoxin system Phd/YefM family antitoxin n=1 Tax=Micromonospora sp. NBRC 101691 TaxID=3032198 RepID=UPI0025530601|nr:type II toxin-antitoxin system Phd/YefM family antitoxin [Micromonospora sp. NBRC 101691]
MTEYPLKDARDQLGSIVLDVRRTREPAIITRYGQPEAVIVDFDEWQELEALRDAADLAVVRARVADGQQPVALDDALRDLDAA